MQLSDSKIADIRAIIAESSFYIASNVRTVVHYSRRTVLFELCGFASETDVDGPDTACRSAVFFDGLAFETGKVGFLSPAGARSVQSEDINGIFCRIVLSEGGGGIVRADYDPLCALPLYHAASDGLAIISDRPAICAAVVGDTAPDPFTATWVSTLGFAMGERTMYNSVRRAPIGGWLLAHDGVVTAGNGPSAFRDYEPLSLEERVQDLPKRCSNRPAIRLLERRRDEYRPDRRQGCKARP